MCCPLQAVKLKLTTHPPTTFTTYTSSGEKEQARLLASEQLPCLLLVCLTS